MTQEHESFVLAGGLDLVTPSLRSQAGRPLAAMNYESIDRGYGRLAGFERYDGRPKPSEASYWLLDFDGGSATPTPGLTLVGLTSAATGIVLDYAIDTGTVGGADAAGTIVLYNVSGTFADNEALQIAGVTIATAAGASVEGAALNDTDDRSWLMVATEERRAVIGPPAGSGAVRGVWIYNGARYAFRDNAAGSAGVMHKATSAGWVAQTFGRSLSYTSGGTYEIAEGDTITGATSGVTATVERVIVTSGDFSTGDAAGRLILSGQTGSFQAENLNVGATVNVATVVGNSSAISLPAGGRYEFENANFFGASDLFRMYGVNGVGPAFEWDGEVLVPILTGMVDDRPTHLAIHYFHLFLAFPGGSLQNSSQGEPYLFDPVTGAAEMGIGQDVVGMLAEEKGIMSVWGRNKVSILYGKDVDTFELVPLNKEAGAMEWTLQMVGTPIYHDDQGLRDMRATSSFGDFKMATISRLIDPIIRAKKEAGITPVASVRVKGKSQYRLFWSDGTGITVYFGRKDPEIMPFNLGKVVSCVCAGKDSDGSEVVLFGSDDGYVYEADVGRSFDGGAVEAYLRLPYNHCGSHGRNKRWHGVDLHIDASPTANIRLLAEYGNSEPDQPPSVGQDFTIYGRGGFWNVDNFNEFYWSAPAEGKAFGNLRGKGDNASIAVYSNETFEKPHVIHGVTLYYTFRGSAKKR